MFAVACCLPFILGGRPVVSSSCPSAGERTTSLSSEDAADQQGERHDCCGVCILSIYTSALKLSRDGYIFKYTDLRSHSSFQKKLGDNQLLKLPGGKFTVREREMLLGILPKEFFNQASQAVNNPFAIGASILFTVCGFVLAWQRFYPDKDFNADE